MSATALNHLQELTSSEAEVRTAAVASLLKELVSNGDKTDLDEESEYLLKRLVAGTASGYASARHGFATALSVVLKASNLSISPDTVLKLMREECAVEKDATATVLRSAMFGKALTLGALVQSGRVFSADHFSNDSFKALIDAILQLHGDKSYLRQISGELVIEMLDQLKTVDTDIQNQAVGILLQELRPVFAGEVRDLSPVHIATALKFKAFVKSQAQTDVNKKRSRKPSSKMDLSNLWLNMNWKPDHCDPFGDCSRERLADIANVMKHTNETLPHLHASWPVVLDDILLRSKDQFAACWSALVDHGLLGSSSLERKAVGLKCLDYVLQMHTVASDDDDNGAAKLTTDQVPALFGENMLRVMINHSKKEGNSLHRAVRVTLRSMVQSLQAQDNDNLKLAVISTLIGPNGSPKFDVLTGTRTVSDLSKSLHSDGMQQYLDSLEAGVGAQNGDSGEGRQVTASMAVASVATLLESDMVANDAGVRRKALSFLLHRAIQGSEDTKESRALRTTALEAIFGLLERRFLRVTHSLVKRQSVVTQSSGKGDAKQQRKNTANGVTGENGGATTEETLEDLLQTLQDTGEAAQKEVTSSKSGFTKAWKKALTSSTALAEARISKTDVTAISVLTLQVLLFVSAVHTNSETPEGDEMAQIDELVTAFEKLVAATQDTTKKSRKRSTDSEPNAHNVMADLVMSLQAQGHSVFRCVGEALFRVIAPAVTEDGLAGILDVASGRDESGKIEDAMEEEDEGEEGEDDIDDDEEEDDEDEEDEDDIDPAFRAKVVEALGRAADEKALEGAEELFRRAAKAGLAEDMDGSSMADESAGTEGEENDVADNEEDDEPEEDEPNMNDDEMMAMDGALGALFAERAKVVRERKEQRRAEEAFRMRALSLCHIFIVKCPESPLIVRILHRLLDALRPAAMSNKHQDLAVRLRTILSKTLIKAKDVPKDVDCEQFEAALEVCVDAMRRPVNGDHASVATKCLLFLLRLPSDDEQSALVVAKCEDLTKDYLCRKTSHVPPSSLADVCERSPEFAGLAIATVSAQSLTVACNAFHAARAAEFVSRTLKFSARIEQVLQENERSQERVAQLTLGLLNAMTALLQKGGKDNDQADEHDGNRLLLEAMKNSHAKDILKNCSSSLQALQRLLKHVVGTTSVDSQTLVAAFDACQGALESARSNAKLQSQHRQRLQQVSQNLTPLKNDAVSAFKARSSSKKRKSAGVDDDPVAPTTAKEPAKKVRKSGKKGSKK
eukprot:Clim_evm11s22 gene=Clim_evmTU11s22